MEQENKVLTELNKIDTILKQVNDKLNDSQLQQNIIYSSISPSMRKTVLNKLNSIYTSLSNLKLNDFQMVKEIRELNKDHQALRIDSKSIFEKALDDINYKEYIDKIEEAFSKANNNFVTISIKHNQCRFNPHTLKTLLENNLQLIYDTLSYYIKQKLLKEKDKKIYISQYNYLKTKFEKFYNAQYTQSTNNNL